MKPDGNILILCAKNSGRSQMAPGEGSLEARLAAFRMGFTGARK